MNSALNTQRLELGEWAFELGWFPPEAEALDFQAERDGSFFSDGEGIGWVCTVEARRRGARAWSRVLRANGGGIPGMGRGAAPIRDSLLVGVGNGCFALAIDDGRLLWFQKVDEYAVFGLHPNSAGDGVIVHGEMDISHWSLGRECRWREGGADLFTGELTVGPEGVRVTDFNGREYRFRE